MVEVRKRTMPEGSLPFITEWEYPWRNNQERKNAPHNARALTESEMRQFLRELHLARFKVGRMADRIDGQYSALYGATVAAHYILGPGMYDDRDIGAFLKNKLEVVLGDCPKCGTPMVRNECYSTFEVGCPVCAGAFGLELTYPGSLRNWRAD